MAMNIEKPDLEKWIPKTEIGRKVKSGEITDIAVILDSGTKILEPEIVDKLIPTLESDLLEVGQSKGKFGGGKASIWKQTQKKTAETNRIKFSSFAVVGNRDGYVGIGFAGARETLPSRAKSIRMAKIDLIKIRRACGSWDCDCKTSHSIPFKVSGKCGSVEVTLMPAPRGTGLKAEKKIARMIALAGIKDVYTMTKGQTATKLNLFRACFEALKQLSSVKMKEEFIAEAGVIEGSMENK